MLRRHILRLTAWSTALVVLLAVFALYLQPDFMVGLAQQVWACF